MLNQSIQEHQQFKKQPKFNNIPNYLIKYQLSFLHPNQLNKARKVCKQWNNMSSTLFEEYRPSIFYVVGRPILVDTGMRTAFASDLATQFIPIIPADEIQAAFNMPGPVTLFFKKEDARHYAHQLMEGDVLEPISIPAVYKVLCTIEDFHKEKKIKLDLNELRDSDFTAKQVDVFNIKDRNSLVPIDGSLAIQYFGKQEYPKVIFEVERELKLDAEQSVSSISKSFCSIL